MKCIYNMNELKGWGWRDCTVVGSIKYFYNLVLNAARRSNSVELKGMGRKRLLSRHSIVQLFASWNCGKSRTNVFRRIIGVPVEIKTGNLQNKVKRFRVYGSNPAHNTQQECLPPTLHERSSRKRCSVLGVIQRFRKRVRRSAPTTSVFADSMGVWIVACAKLFTPTFSPRSSNSNQNNDVWWVGELSDMIGWVSTYPIWIRICPV